MKTNKQKTAVTKGRRKMQVVVKKHSNGRVKIRCSGYRGSDGIWINHGTYREFYKNGKPYVVEHYKHGKQHGGLMMFDGCGRLLIIGDFSEGCRHGRWEFYDRIGQVVDCHFENGILCGQIVSFDEADVPTKAFVRPDITTTTMPNIINIRSHGRPR